MADTPAVGRLRRLLRPCVALAAGACAALGHPPFDLWPVGLLALAVGVGSLPAPTARSWAVQGWALGVGYFGVALSWIVEPFFIDAAAHGWMAPFALIGMAGGLALFWALAFGAAGWLQAGRGGGMLLLVPLWGLSEMARGTVLTGFPWAAPGYLWLETPVAQWGAVFGIHGLTALALALCAAGGVLGVAVLSQVRRGVGPRSSRPERVETVPSLARPPASFASYPAVSGLVLVGALVWTGGLWLTPPRQDLADRPVVRLVQPNAPQHLKWDPNWIQTFHDRKIRATAAPLATDGPASGPARPALIVWPETALAGLLERSGPVLAQIARAADGATVALGVQRSAQGAYFNALAAIGPDGGVRAVYDKHHLVPFGEYMPLPRVWARWNIAGLAARAEGGYTPGPGPRLMDFGRLGRALPLICYEAVFPQDVNAAPGRPDFLLHVTNDAWFGTWSGPYQHLAQARMRAIEQGLPLMRAANTGVSASIDGAGRVLASLPLGQAGHLDTALPPPLRVTPYSRVGDWPLLVVLIASIGVIAWGTRHESR